MQGWIGRPANGQLLEDKRTKRRPRCPLASVGGTLSSIAYGTDGICTGAWLPDRLSPASLALRCFSACAARYNPEGHQSGGGSPLHPAASRDRTAPLPARRWNATREVSDVASVTPAPPASTRAVVGVHRSVWRRNGAAGPPGHDALPYRPLERSVAPERHSTGSYYREVRGARKGTTRAPAPGSAARTPVGSEL